MESDFGNCWPVELKLEAVLLQYLNMLCKLKQISPENCFQMKLETRLRARLFFRLAPTSHLITMVHVVVAVSPRRPRGLVTLVMQRMTVRAPHTPVAMKTPVHVAVEILKMIKRELYFELKNKLAEKTIFQSCEQ